MARMVILRNKNVVINNVMEM